MARRASYGYGSRRPSRPNVLDTILPKSRIEQPPSMTERQLRNLQKAGFPNYSIFAQPAAVQGSLSATDAVWATARGAATGSVETDYRARANTGYVIWRHALVYDTSSIPDGATLIAARLRYLAGAGSYPVDTDTSDLVAVDLTLADEGAVAAGDYDGFGTTEYGRIALSSIGANPYLNTFPLTDTFLAAVSLTANTVLGLRISNDVDDSAPTGDDSMLFIDEASYGSLVLEIDYTT